MNIERGATGRGRVAGLPDWDRCAVMGVVNVTPDSFSDGGRWFDTTAAVKRGLDLVAQGADLVDVGGESTRPGASRVDEEEELRRVVPVVRGLASEGVTVSVDTMRASVAARAVAAGALLVNDVSGGLADPGMIPAVAAAEVPFVVMHWRGFSDSMNSLAVYEDVLAEVTAELRTRIDAVVAGGIAPSGSSSTPASASPRTPSTTWPWSPTSPNCAPSASRCSSPRRANDSSAGYWPAPTPHRRPPASATPPPPPCPPSPPTRAPGPYGSMRYGPPPTRFGWPAPWKGPCDPPRRWWGPYSQERGTVSRTDIEAVDEVNTAFYEAMERGTSMHCRRSGSKTRSPACTRAGRCSQAAAKCCARTR